MVHRLFVPIKAGHESERRLSFVLCVGDYGYFVLVLTYFVPRVYRKDFSEMRLQGKSNGCRGVYRDVHNETTA